MITFFEQRSICEKPVAVKTKQLYIQFGEFLGSRIDRPSNGTKFCLIAACGKKLFSRLLKTTLNPSFQRQKIDIESVRHVAKCRARGAHLK